MLKFEPARRIEIVCFLLLKLFEKACSTTGSIANIRKNPTTLHRFQKIWFSNECVQDRGRGISLRLDMGQPPPPGTTNTAVVGNIRGLLRDKLAWTKNQCGRNNSDAEGIRANAEATSAQKGVCGGFLLNKFWNSRSIWWHLGHHNSVNNNKADYFFGDGREKFKRAQKLTGRMTQVASLRHSQQAPGQWPGLLFFETYRMVITLTSSITGVFELGTRLHWGTRADLFGDARLVQLPKLNFDIFL